MVGNRDSIQEENKVEEEVKKARGVFVYKGNADSFLFKVCDVEEVYKNLLAQTGFVSFYEEFRIKAVSNRDIHKFQIDMDKGKVYYIVFLCYRKGSLFERADVMIKTDNRFLKGNSFYLPVWGGKYKVEPAFEIEFRGGLKIKRKRKISEIKVLPLEETKYDKDSGLRYNFLLRCSMGKLLGIVFEDQINGKKRFSFLQYDKDENVFYLDRTEKLLKETFFSKIPLTSEEREDFERVKAVLHRFPFVFSFVKNWETYHFTEKRELKDFLMKKGKEMKMDFIGGDSKRILIRNFIGKIEKDELSDCKKIWEMCCLSNSEKNNSSQVNSGITLFTAEEVVFYPVKLIKVL